MLSQLVQWIKPLPLPPLLLMLAIDLEGRGAGSAISNAASSIGYGFASAYVFGPTILRDPAPRMDLYPYLDLPLAPATSG